MTIGERVALKRKEQNMSQEALGEALGVSRQSISKWEGGVSLPEIEKLIAMSRLFGVSVGWLLGVEEEQAADGAAPSQREELTAAQLKMVEEIVDRYIAAQPKPLAPWRRRTFKICIAAAGVCLAMGLFWLGGQLEQLDSQYNSLQNSMNNVTNSVNSQVNGIANQVEQVLKSQNELTADYDAQYQNVDIAAGTVKISASAVPKTYREGMTALFLAECDGETLEFPAQLGEGQSFSAEFDCPLVDDIRVSVVFLHGDTRETQFLQDFYSLYSSTIPEVWLNTPVLTHDAAREDGSLSIPEEIVSVEVMENNAYQLTEEVAPVENIQVGLFKNKELVVWGTQTDKPDNYHGFEGCLFYQFDALSLPVEEGDTLCYAALVTDEYGRATVWGGEMYHVTSSTEMEQNEPASAAPAYYYEYDDPADWGL